MEEGKKKDEINDEEKKKKKKKEKETKNNEWIRKKQKRMKHFSFHHPFITFQKTEQENPIIVDEARECSVHQHFLF